MASNLFVTFAIVAIVLPTVSMATEYTVGDDDGWKPDFDYQNWAKDKVFRVGDELVFKYTAPNHNVIKVNGADFKNCSVPKLSEPLTSGNDKITLATSGRKWYICGKADHCSRGQKLVITVVSDAPTPTPTPTPGNTDNSAAYGIVSSGSPIIAAAMVLMATMIML